MQEKICEMCKQKFPSLPLPCLYCDSSFCNKHHKPENHNCPSLEKIKTELQKNKQGDSLYTSENWKKTQLKILYYIIIMAITMLAVVLLGRGPT